MGPCMVIEMVEPIGLDLFHVLTNYAYAHRVMPVGQWMHYLRQLISAVECLHGKGWVHCDIKGENLLITKDNSVKLIDFGLAKIAGQERSPERVGYMPPEFDDIFMLAQTPADLWLIGGVMVNVFLHDGFDLESGSKIFHETKEKGVTWYIRRYEKELEPRIEEAMSALLRWNPEDRWTLAQLKDWAGDEHAPAIAVREPSLNRSSTFEYSPLRTTSAQYFNRARKLNKLIRGYGLEIKRGSSYENKYIGRHSRDGVEIDGNQIFEKGAWNIIFIDRPEGVISIPQAEHQVKLHDWVYMRKRNPVENSKDDESHLRRLSSASAEYERECVQIFLDFDEFEFPLHCVGAGIGGWDTTPRDCTMAMDLRKNFGIGLAFMVRRDRIMEISAETVVEQGDCGLVVRIPDRSTGRTKSILSDSLLAPLFDEDLFNERVAPLP